MQNKSTPKFRKLPQHIEIGQDDAAGGWSATLNEVHQHAAQHISLRNRPEDKKSKSFLALLAGVVEGQVIPRLMLAHKSVNPDVALDDEGIVKRATADPKKMDPNIIEPFANLVLAGTVDDLEDFVVAITAEGFSSDAIYLDLMAPAARLLGQYWEDDKCSFTDVTLGLGRLQTLLYRLSASQTPGQDISPDAPKALFLTPEGSQHSLGVRMVEELFREAGWRTLCEINTSKSVLIDLVENEAFDLVGVGLSAEGQIEQTRDIIALIRKASVNRRVKVILGGKLIVDDPDLAIRLGADLFARDGKEAIVIANKLLYNSSPTH
jgi:MerR family transcriptional regulator, light-induced transcriptional regulator